MTSCCYQIVLSVTEMDHFSGNDFAKRVFLTVNALAPETPAHIQNVLPARQPKRFMPQ